MSFPLLLAGLSVLHPVQLLFFFAILDVFLFPLFFNFGNLLVVSGFVRFLAFPALVAFYLLDFSFGSSLPPESPDFAPKLHKLYQFILVWLDAG